MSKKTENNFPSTSPSNVSADIIADLKLISEVFQKIEQETAEIAEMIFGYLIDVSDADIINGTIPDHKNPKLKRYIQILNRLFRFSRNHAKDGLIGMIVINRKTVKALDRKTYAISMCFDGGASLDILCDIVNEENCVRTPTKSPVRVTVRQAFNDEQRSR